MLIDVSFVVIIGRVFSIPVDCADSEEGSRFLLTAVNSFGCSRNSYFEHNLAGFMS